MDFDQASAPPVAPPISPPAVLRGRRLSLARYAWLTAAVLILSFFAAGIPVYFERLRTVCVEVPCDAAPTPPPGAQELKEAGLSTSFYAAYYTALDVVVALVYLAVAALIFRQRSGERIALLGAFTLLIWGPFSIAFTISAATEVHPQWRPALEYVQFLGLVFITLFFFLFPDGRFVPRWARWLAFALILLLMPGYIWPDSLADYRQWPPLMAGSFLLTWMGSIIGLQVYRYRQVSDTVRRQQTKWVVFGLAGSFLGFFAFVSLPFLISSAFHEENSILRNLIANTGGGISMLLLPVSIGTAILRYRLWDIDVVINRALVYGVLTAVVVGLYALIVGGLGTLLRVEGNFLLSLLAAGLMAVLFAPIKDRLQRGANRLMYGERDEPYRVLSRLGHRLEATLAPDDVLPAIVQTVRDAFKLPYAAIESRDIEGFSLAASAGQPASDPLRLPLVHQGERVGELVLGPRAGEKELSPADRRLLEELARQVGVAVHAVRVAADLRSANESLRAARERLVSAREEERRRLRRDLHDGLGPALASESLKAGAARKLLARDPAAADALLAELGNDIEGTIHEIRRLVYDLRPPALDELGLAGAIRERVAQYCGGIANNGLRVVVAAPDRLPALPAAVEVAAYRIVQEALTNVVRHASARACAVRLALQAGALCVEVVDDGVGMPAERKAGVGLRSMHERAEELGGSLTAEVLPIGGTRVFARLPLPKE